MRAVSLAIALVVLCAGCARFGRDGGSQALTYEATLQSISSEVASLPESPSKDRLRSLLTDLRARISGWSAATSGSTPAEWAAMRAAAEAVIPHALELGFATDGKDWTGDGIDDGVEIHLSPTDAVGNAIKSPGAVRVIMREPSGLLGSGGDEIDRWTITPDTLQHSWSEALFPAYILRLPWHQRLPRPGKASVEVTFTPLYGNAVSAAKEVEIKALKPPATPTTPATSAAPATPATPTTSAAPATAPR